MADTIHQEVVFNAPVARVYEALTDSAQFSKAVGGAPTELPRQAGAEFSCFGGMIEGRQLELVPNQRLVQAWRAKSWAPGEYSIAKFELRAEGDQTRLVFDHAGFPKGQGEHLAAGWTQNYWEPIKKLLG